MPIAITNSQTNSTHPMTTRTKTGSLKSIQCLNPPHTHNSSQSLYMPEPTTYNKASQNLTSNELWQRNSMPYKNKAFGSLYQLLKICLSLAVVGHSAQNINLMVQLQGSKLA
ncbi:hypothetical protein KFK09_009780 [Dendrobium nobile]|uniref:Uncharacterized protein n=1 Tax=Dendrobium nobile TaxID=94219 RepID=A0A8T3BIK0_DENNO|nr:hypothetical protein KFK09_009780 [Dendrobium nobile]